MIAFRQFSYRYPETKLPALADVTFDLPRGALALVTGASGVGKSTLLRATNGLVPHFTGGAVMGTVRVAGLDPLRVGPGGMGWHVGFVAGDPESSAVVDVVEDEVAFALEHRGLDRTAMRGRVADALARVGLAEMADRRIATLSGGERQRVAIAAALALRPEVLVLDEPTSQIDDDAASALLAAVVDLARSGDLTVVVSEHRLDRVLPHATHLVVMPSRSRSPLVGPPADLLTAIARHETPLPPALDPGPVVLQFDHVSHAYGGQPVLTDVSLAVRSGEIVALTGPSGAGKTTMLRLAVGLLAPATGEICVEGMSIAGLAVAEICQRVGYLPQDPGALLFADTVRRELEITLANHGLPAAGAYDPDRLLAELGLAVLAADYPRDLSTGQRQRVALGAIAVTNPAVLLLDEPTRGLDDAAIAALARLLHARAAAGAGILVATHDRRLTRAAHRLVRLVGRELSPVV